LKHLWRNLLLAVLLGAGAQGGGPLADKPLLGAEGPGAPLPGFASGETLRYKLFWPGGFSLGEAVLAITPSEKELRFELTVEADLPTHNIVDSFTSVATRETLCSSKFQRKSREGAKASEESVEFDQKAHQARRTRGGQTAAFPIPECARDPLTFLYYFRSQIAAGAPINSATFYVGSGYGLEIRPAGAETVRVGGRERQAEKYFVTYRGPNSEKTFELWISTDSRRELVLFRVPFPLAVFSAELQ
jgi:hypothetical protein